MLISMSYLFYGWEVVGVGEKLTLWEIIIFDVLNSLLHQIPGTDFFKDKTTHIIRQTQII
jgi:hypothetical protein